MPQAITISGPPEDAKLIFESMTGHEELGRLFEFKLNLLSENKAVKIDDVLGKNLTVTIEFTDDRKRYFRSPPLRNNRPSR